MRHISLFPAVASILLTMACRQEDKLEAALAYSGENRTELERVIRHYSQQEADSLELRAARFLIENMPGHYAPDAPVVRQFQARMDSLYPDMGNVLRRPVFNLPMRLLGSQMAWRPVEDIHVMKADYLIRHVDNALRMWRECPWLRQFSFDDFCEYVLPYRVANEPILEEDSTWHIWQTAAQRLEAYGYEPKTMGEYKTLQRDLLEHTIDDARMKRLHTGLPGRATYSFECLDRCYYEVSRLRAIGIPCAVDFVPGWPHRSGRHYWHMVLEPFYQNRNSSSEPLNARAAKIYRMTYSRQPIPWPTEGETVPALFRSPFCRDVTNEYVQVSDVTCKVDGVSAQYAYLCIFNDLEWKPVAWTTVEGGKACFHDMGRGVIYLPVCFEGRQMKSIGHPFLLDMHGQTREFAPDKSKHVTLRFTRKYPVDERKIIWGEGLRGVQVEASDDPDFRTADTLCTIDHPNTALNYLTLRQDAPAAYRYWRLHKEGSFLDVGEWELLDGQGRKLTPARVLTCRDDDKTAPKAFDGNVLEYALSPDWFGADMGRRVTVSSMRVIPRTDDNGITPGHIYELYYYDTEGWKLSEAKRATADSIVFDKAPAGALYWLRDKTAGREERIFIYEQGRVIWM